MSNDWTVVTYKKKSKDSTDTLNIKYSKPKIKNYIKEKIIKHISITDDDNDIFKIWKHDYLVGKIYHIDTKDVFRDEDKYLILEYTNKFKIYKNYNKINVNDFLQIFKNISLDKTTFLKYIKSILKR